MIELSVIESMVIEQALKEWKKPRKSRMCQKDSDFIDNLMAKIKISARAEIARMKIITRER